MMRVKAVAALFADLHEADLVIWIERGWVRPAQIGHEQAEHEWVFHEIDIARVRLIHDLRHRMAVNDEALPVILSLLDQVHDLRVDLRSVLQAVERQPAAVRQAIREALE